MNLEQFKKKDPIACRKDRDYVALRCTTSDLVDSASVEFNEKSRLGLEFSPLEDYPFKLNRVDS